MTYNTERAEELSLERTRKIKESMRRRDEERAIVVLVVALLVSIIGVAHFGV